MENGNGYTIIGKNKGRIDIEDVSIALEAVHTSKLLEKKKEKKYNLGDRTIFLVEKNSLSLFVYFAKIKGGKNEKSNKFFVDNYSM